MSLKKRGRTWHTDFFMDGQRFRQSLDTTDWREAQSKEKDLIAAAKAGRLSVTKKKFARLTFRDAAEQFLQDRIPELAPLSIRTERERAKVLNRIFADIPVSRIAPDDILAYVRGRKANNIANATVNRELDVLRGVLEKSEALASLCGRDTASSR